MKERKKKREGETPDGCRERNGDAARRQEGPPLKVFVCLFVCLKVFAKSLADETGGKRPSPRSLKHLCFS